MGIFSNITEKMQIGMAKAIEEIRREEDIKKRESLIEQKAKEFDLEKHKQDIKRLANLDKQKYDLELKRILAQQREKDQFDEREKIRMDNECKNRQKELANNELYEVKLAINLPINSISVVYAKDRLTKVDKQFIKEYIKM